LGITICKANRFKCCWSEAKCKFFQSVNSILGRLGTCAPLSVLIKLTNSHGLQNLLYGTAAATLSKADLKSLDFAYNGLFAKIFKVTDQSIICQIQFYCGNLPFHLSYDLFRFNFLRKLLLQGLLNVNNIVDASDFADLITLQNKFGFLMNDSHNNLKYKMWTYFKNLIFE